MRSQRFPRSRRLKRQRLIRPLFDKNRSDIVRVRIGVLTTLARWVSRDEVGAETSFQIGFAPGRRRTNAQRTHVRRLLREAFRQNQAPLQSLDPESPKVLTAMILFRGRDETASEDIRRDMPDIVARLVERMCSTADGP